MLPQSYYTPTYDEIHKACANFVDLFDEYGFEFKRVVGVSRGGLFPALILSHALNIPLTPVSYSSKGGKGDNKNHTNILPTFDATESPVLLVDDIVDSGLTMKEIADHLTSSGIEVYTLALFYKVRSIPTIVPNFKWRKIPENSPWVVFPFEKVEGPTNE